MKDKSMDKSTLKTIFAIWLTATVLLALCAYRLGYVSGWDAGGRAAIATGERQR